MTKEAFIEIFYESNDVGEKFKSGLDAIVIFSGSAVERTSRRGIKRISSTVFDERDTRGNLSLGKYRMLAGAELSKQFPEAKVVTLCWSVDKTGVRFPSSSDSSVLGQELLIHGVATEKLIINNGDNPQAFDTFTEMLDTLQMALNNNWTRVAVIGPHFQKERAQEMLSSLRRQSPYDIEQIQRVFTNYKRRFPNLPLETIDYFRNVFAKLQLTREGIQGINVELVSAEAIMLLRNPKRYGRIIEKIATSDGYAQEEKNGSKGATNWRDHEYGLPQNIVIQ